MNRNKDRAVLAAGLAGIALIVGACAEAAGPNESTVDNGYSEVSTTTTPTTTVAKAAPASTTVAAMDDYPTMEERAMETSFEDNAFLETMEEMGLSHIPDDTLLNAGLATCAFLSTGGDAEILFSEIANDPFQPDIFDGIDNIREMPQVMGAANAIYCPHLG